MSVSYWNSCAPLLQLMHDNSPVFTGSLVYFCSQNLAQKLLLLVSQCFPVWLDSAELKYDEIIAVGVRVLSCGFSKFSKVQKKSWISSTSSLTTRHVCRNCIELADFTLCAAAVVAVLPTIRISGFCHSPVDICSSARAEVSAGRHGSECKSWQENDKHRISFACFPPLRYFSVTPSICKHADDIYESCIPASSCLLIFFSISALYLKFNFIMQTLR